MPALMDVNDPGRGVASPNREPQQTTVPPVCIPQVWFWPALTDSNEPAGGVD